MDPEDSRTPKVSGVSFLTPSAVGRIKARKCALGSTGTHPGTSKQATSAVSWADKVRNGKTIKPAKDTGRLTLCTWKLYLDSCATYHSCFVDWCLDNIETVDTVLRGNCNAGVTTTNTKGYFGLFHMWLNKKGIANLLSIPQLEEDGYRVTCDTNTEWAVYTPSGTKIPFKRDKGLCNRMPYVDMREQKEAFAMVETVRSNFEGYTKR